MPSCHLPSCLSAALLPCCLAPPRPLGLQNLSALEAAYSRITEQKDLSARSSRITEIQNRPEFPPAQIPSAQTPSAPIPVALSAALLPPSSPALRMSFSNVDLCPQATRIFENWIDSASKKHGQGAVRYELRSGISFLPGSTETTQPGP